MSHVPTHVPFELSDAELRDAVMQCNAPGSAGVLQTGPVRAPGAVCRTPAHAPDRERPTTCEESGTWAGTVESRCC